MRIGLGTHAEAFFVDFGTSLGSHLEAKLDQKSTFLGCKKQVLKEKLFQGFPRAKLEAKSGFLEAFWGAFWYSTWNLLKSQK